MPDRTSLPAWKDLQAHATDLEIHHLRQLINDDPQRFERLSVAELDFLYDFTRQRLTANTIRLLLDLARACNLEERIEALYAGEAVNNTERLRNAMCMAARRSVLFTASPAYSASMRSSRLQARARSSSSLIVLAVSRWRVKS